MSVREPADHAVRITALDPSRSFIVQAPAGSGKTGILIQRYLRLLAGAEHPEEVIAITFTRKAAGEMRERILDALARAADDPTGGASHPSTYEATTLQLARAVVDRDAQHGWSIAAQPSRLRILTIDALCRAIATQMPWLSGLGGDANIVEDVTPLYAQAARNTITLLEEDATWSEPVATLLAHLDGDVGRFESLLVEMLSKRDQWLPYLRPGQDDSSARRAELESELARAIVDELGALAAEVPAPLVEPIVEVCRFAGDNLRDNAPPSPGAACADLDTLPEKALEDLALWRGIAEVLLTRDGKKWRTRLSKREGFPSDRRPRSIEMRDRAKALMAALTDAETFRERLHAVRALPASRYTDGQWRVLNALLRILPVATASLRVVFGERGQVDYTEVTNAARQALGNDEAPTDLALALDYRIRHLLVDEFQDTSHSHFALLTQLVAGWTPGDGRTLFLVGDPMQSIYRFREADVGLFLHVAEHGLPGFPLEALRLSANFRSSPDIVDWVNTVFPGVMAKTDDAIAGAVSYTPSTEFREPNQAGGVCVHALFDADRETEARKVVELVGAARAAEPLASIAILVRNRAHLEAILPRLRDAGIGHRGVDIEPLAEVPVVEDLLALTRALLHPADRVAWLAVLRAPWCGMSLADLHVLASGDPRAILIDLLRDDDRLARMSADGRVRSARLAKILETALDERGRHRLRRWIEGVWIALGGPACVARSQLPNVAAYLELLDELDVGEGSMDGDELTRRTARLYAVSGVENAAVEIMTVHKAKGLEFDTVVVPGLDRVGRGEERRLLAWAKRAGEPEDANILLAPIPSPAEGASPIYDYLYRLDADKAAHEQSRLLYVAVTRARRALHLLGSADTSADGETVQAPVGGSLLAGLWPAVAEAFEEAVAFYRGNVAGARLTREDHGLDAGLHRLPSSWQTPAPPPPVEASVIAVDERAPEEPPAAVEFDWAGEIARHVGTVIHRALCRLSHEGVSAWDRGRLARQRPAWGSMLASLGVPEQDRAPALTRVEQALQQALDDSRGRWLLSSEHREARSEYALSGMDGGVLANVIIDRTFVDDDGVRWIVDYKSGRHEGGNPDAFLDRERERYRKQLERYARLMARVDARPIRLALYFPVMRGWREWSFETPPG